MTRLTQAVALLLGLVACYQPVHEELLPDEPLEISILPPDWGGAGWWVNQPAYVAIFDIVPDAGVSMLYPRTSYDLEHVARAGQSYVHAVGSIGRLRPFFATSRLPQPHYLLAIASRKPLRMQNPASYASYLEGHYSLLMMSVSPFEAMDQVRGAVVPDQPDGDWASAVYVVYPNVNWRQNIYQFVRCPDGYIYVVSLRLATFSCPKPPATTIVAKPTESETDFVRKDGSQTVTIGRLATPGGTRRPGDLQLLQTVGFVERPVAPPAFRGSSGSPFLNGRDGFSSDRRLSGSGGTDRGNSSDVSGRRTLSTGETQASTPRPQPESTSGNESGKTDRRDAPQRPTP